MSRDSAWIERAERLLDAMGEELGTRLGEMSPEQIMASMAAIGQRVTTHRAVVVSSEPVGTEGDRRDRQAAERGAKGARSAGSSLSPRKRRAKAPTAP